MEFYEEAFMRNIGVFTPEEQQKIKKTNVLIAGCGGMGSQSAEQMVRLGFEKFTVADFDVYNIVNINNQFNCTKETIGRNKAEVTAERIKSINPNAEVRVFVEGVKAENINDVIKNAEIVIDAIDYNNQADSAILHKVAREKGLYVYAPQAIGFGASVLVFDPEGTTLVEHIGEEAIASGKIPAEKFSPHIPTYVDAEAVKAVEERSGDYLPNIATAQCLGVAMLLGEALGYLLKGKKPITVPKVYMIDLWDKKIIT